MPDLFTPEDRRERIKELKISLEDIASLYRNPNVLEDCKCIDIECEKPGCPRWWAAFFFEFDGRDLVDMVNLFLFTDPEEEAG